MATFHEPTIGTAVTTDDVSGAFSCAVCQGAGSLADERCRMCQGIGQAIIIAGQPAYVPQELTAGVLRTERFVFRTQMAIRAVSLAVAIVAALYVLTKALLDALSGELLTQVNGELLEGWSGVVIWAGLLGAVHVYASLERDLAGATPIPPRTYSGSRPKTRLLEWRRVHPINIYQTLTAPAKRRVLESLEAVHRARRPYHPGFLLLAIVKDGAVRSLFGRLGIPLRRITGPLERRLVKDRGESSLALADILKHAYIAAYRNGQRHISEPLLLSAIVALDPFVQEVFYDVGVDAEKIDNVLVWQQNDELLHSRYRRLRERARLLPQARIDRALTGVATPLLDVFSEDLTEQAQRGYFLPTVRRSASSEQLLKAFESGSNVLLIGEPGVGKRGILEDVADRIISGEVPSQLSDKRLVNLSLSRLVSGASLAESTARLQRILTEVIRSRNIVLVVSDIEGAVGVSHGDGASVDLAQVLAEGLRRLPWPTIGTTQPEAFRRFLEGTALGVRFSPLRVPEPSLNEAIQIVESRLGLAEMRYRVYYSYDAVAALVELTDKFIHDRRLPKKALEYVDELALSVRQARGPQTVILRADVERFLSEKLNIPTRDVGVSESSLLLNFEERVHERLVDQEPAVRAVADALRRARAAVRDTRRPIVNLLFLGPTGVGKTELAKTVAALYFGDERRMVRLDMSEYQGSDSVARLLGGERGGADGALTGPVRANPFCLLLLDEIDKADRNVLNLFLQVMDDGRVTAGTGEVIDFTNVILVATSNAGTAFIQDALREEMPMSTIEQQLGERELRKYFQPEFINRFDGVIVFKPLSPEDVYAIARLLLRAVAARLATHGVAFEASEEAVRELAALGYNPEFGARPLRRVLQDRVDAALARLLLAGQLSRRDRVRLEAGMHLTIEHAAEL